MLASTRRAFCLALVPTLFAPAMAQSDAAKWPDRPVRLVVPFTPGGGTDALSRLMAEKIGSQFKWTLVVENKPGAGGNIGLDVVAKSRPDGYTIGMGQTSNLAINPVLMPSVPFDATKDFAPVALVAAQPQILVVKEDSKYKTLADLIAEAKKKPGAVKQALAGIGTVGHLAGEMLAYQGGFSVLNVPYKGASPALADLLGSQTDFMFTTPQAAMEMIRGKRLRAIAVTSSQRSRALPDVPTVAESGYPGFEAIDWKGFVAPAGTPPAIVAKINEAVQAALKQPETATALMNEGSTPMPGTAQDAAAFIKAQQQHWRDRIRETKVKLD